MRPRGALKFADKALQSKATGGKMKIINGNIASPKGYTADAIHAGLKRKNLDLGVILSEVPASVAGVFTTNKVSAAPVRFDRKIVAGGKCQAIVCNSAVANAVTGAEGEANTAKTAELVAEQFGLPEQLTAVCSTGVIGKQLPMDIMASGIKQLSANGNAESFAQAILTTDTKTKEITVETELSDGTSITMSGCCKGSGMIHPNMATMLAFITTDAKISSELLQQALSELVETTFNQITVDGDTSTNDTVLVLANGMAGGNEISAKSNDFSLFKEMLALVMQTLAKKIAADGEGATKLIEVILSGAPDDLQARMLAKKIVGSSLVKTAIFGADPNWGRIISAIGQYAEFELPDVSLKIQGKAVLEHSTPLEFDKRALSEELKADKIFIDVDLHAGSGKGQAWGCDLTYKYVEINALYTT